VTAGNIKGEYVGASFRVVHCKKALESFREAIKHIDSRKRNSFSRGMVLQIERLAGGQRMSKDNFPQEGLLPKRKGSASAKKFNAMKRLPIRGYCWLSEEHKNTYFISHYVYKNYTKLKDSDTNKVKKNWVRIEEQGHEC